MTEEAKKPEFGPQDFSPEAQQELRTLANLEILLKKVKGLEGDEAFAYVDARRYIATKAAMLQATETAKLRAAKAKEVKPEAEKPPLAVVPTPPAE